jgi:hypothetical protein
MGPVPRNLQLPLAPQGLTVCACEGESSVVAGRKVQPSSWPMNLQGCTVILVPCAIPVIIDSHMLALAALDASGSKNYIPNKNTHCEK